jgi:hypothetical protein
MSRTPITPVQVTQAGVASMAPVAADVANGNSMANNARLMIGVTNSDTSIHNFSITPTRLDGGGHAQAVSTPVAASTTSPVWFGPYSTRDYGSTLLINGDNAGIHFQGYAI